MKKTTILIILCSNLSFGQNHTDQNTYEYDNLNRLTKVIFNSGIIFEYQYDNLGNRLGKTIDVELDNTDFTIVSNDVDGCDEGNLTITVGKRNFYHIQITDTNTNSLIVSEDFWEAEYTIDLDIGDYEFCIRINDIPLSTFDYCSTFSIIDATDISSINSTTFSQSVIEIEECNLTGEITINATEDIDCHPYLITLEDEDGNQIANGTFTDSISFDNLELGNYTYCIVIEGLEDDFQECVDFELIDQTDTSGIGYSNFDLKAYGNFYNSNGTLELNVDDFLPCHEYSYFLERLSGNGIPSDDIGINPNSNIYMNNLSFGEYELYIDVENIDPSVFRLTLYIEILPENDEVIAYKSCQFNGMLNLLLPDIGTDYEASTYLENGLQNLTLLLPNQGLLLLGDEFNNQYFTVDINKNQSENEFFFYNCFLDDYEPFLVVEEISYNNNNPTVTLTYSGGVRPYYATIYHPETNSYEANFEQHNTTGSLTYNLLPGRNEISLEHGDYCNSFYKEIFIPTEFIMYPNPTSTILNIGVPLGVIQQGSMIGIFDMTGKQIDLFDIEPNNIIKELDVSNYSTGTYLVKIFTKEQQLYWTGKFIKK